MAVVSWLIPALIGAVFFGLALMGAAAIVRKLISIGNMDISNDALMKQAKTVNPEPVKPTRADGTQ
jgi:hypothetical protein